MYLDNAYCCTPGCKTKSLYTNDGTRDNRICGDCKKKLPKEEQKKYENVVDKKCETCKKQHPSFAFVPNGMKFKDMKATHCGTCVKNLPDEEREKFEDVSNKRCETCNNRHPSFAIVEYANEKTYKTTPATHCGSCVKNLPDEEREKFENVANKRCEEDGCEIRAYYAESYMRHLVKFCGKHAPRDFVDVNKKPCPGIDGKGCPRTGTIHGYKPSGLCAWCDPDGRTKRFELAVLNYLKLKYDIDDQYPIDAYERKRTHLIDGVILFDGVIIAIEVDEKSGHKDDEADERRMIVCEDYLEEEHGVPVAWIRIVPDIRGGKRILGEGGQFSEKAIAIREEILNRVLVKINELLKNPASGVFYFEQL
jgi:hypothetical protein